MLKDKIQKPEYINNAPYYSLLIVFSSLAKSIISINLKLNLISIYS